MPRYKYLAIIQARIGSTRLPGKVFMTVGGVPMVKRVWNAAVSALLTNVYLGQRNKVVVAWPERYPDLDESNVLERFRRVSSEFPSMYIIRLTADCPLLTVSDILEAVESYHKSGAVVYGNGRDGHDVQVFSHFILDSDWYTHREHVIAGPAVTGGTSVNTKADLERVRKLCAISQS